MISRSTEYNEPLLHLYARISRRHPIFPVRITLQNFLTASRPLRSPFHRHDRY